MFFEEEASVAAICVVGEDLVGVMLGLILDWNYNIRGREERN